MLNGNKTPNPYPLRELGLEPWRLGCPYLLRKLGLEPWRPGWPER